MTHQLDFNILGLQLCSEPCNIQLHWPPQLGQAVNVSLELSDLLVQLLILCPG